MVTGTVNRTLGLTINVAVRTADDQFRQVEAFVDTGFNGALALPTKLVEELSLEWRRAESSVILADGSEALFEVYAAMIRWDGKERRVLVDAAGSVALVGMSLLEGYDLHTHLVPGGVVHLTALPSAS